MDMVVLPGTALDTICTPLISVFLEIRIFMKAKLPSADAAGRQIKKEKIVVNRSNVGANV